MLFVVFISGCDGDDGLSGINSLVVSTEESPGSNCGSGGVRIDVGPDTNRNGTLDPGEIQSTQFVCNGMNGSSIDLVRFPLLIMSGLSSTTLSPNMSAEWQYLRKFRKSDFSSMRSATLSAYIRCNDAGTTGTVDLYNITDNVPLAGTEISATDTGDGVWVDSGNFWDNLPDKEIDIAMRIRTSIEGSYVLCMQANLTLSKD
jgi:hypothetical protein